MQKTATCNLNSHNFWQIKSQFWGTNQFFSFIISLLVYKKNPRGQSEITYHPGMIPNKEDIVQNQLLYFQTTSLLQNHTEYARTTLYKQSILKISLFLKVTSMTTCSGQQGLYRSLHTVFWTVFTLSEHFTFLSHCSFSTERIATCKQISKTKKILSCPWLWKNSNKTHQPPPKNNNQIPQKKTSKGKKHQ